MQERCNNKSTGSSQQKTQSSLLANDLLEGEIWYIKYILRKVLGGGGGWRGGIQHLKKTNTVK